MTDPRSLELEDESEPAAVPVPDPAGPPAPRPRSAPATPPPRAGESRGLPAVLDDRRRKRLLRFVPTMAVAFLLVGWLLVGGSFWVFALVGAALGVFAAWRRRSEVVLGTVAAVAGTVAAYAVGDVFLGVRGALVIIASGVIGFVAGLDDRLRGG